MLKRAAQSLLITLLALQPLLAQDAATQPGGAAPDPAIAGPTILVEPGKFNMGSPLTEPDRSSDENQRHIRITRPYYIGRHEVTVGQFKKFVDDTGYKTDAEKAGKAWAYSAGNTVLTKDVTWRNPGFDQADNHPVVVVSFNDAQAYCAWLSKKLRQTCTLPTEAQWEFAARSADKTAFGPGTLDETAWHRENAEGKTHPVETKKPNTWGLFDTHGNAMEWTLDRYAPYPDTSPKTSTRNPSGPKTPEITGDEKRSTRGGSWAARQSDCRSAARSKFYPDSASNFSGFRIIILPNETE